MRIKVKRVWRQTYGDGTTIYGFQVDSAIPLGRSESLGDTTSPAWHTPENCDVEVDTEYIYKNTYVVIDPAGEIGLIFKNDEDHKQFFGE